jgi:hypothetical protein
VCVYVCVCVCAYVCVYVCVCVCVCVDGNLRWHISNPPILFCTSVRKCVLLLPAPFREHTFPTFAHIMNKRGCNALHNKHTHTHTHTRTHTHTHTHTNTHTPLDASNLLFYGGLLFCLLPRLFLVIPSCAPNSTLASTPRPPAPSTLERRALDSHACYVCALCMKCARTATCTL